MPSRTDIRSIKHVFAAGALSLALSLPVYAQTPTPAAAPAASLMDLPGATTAAHASPPAANIAPAPATSVQPPVTPTPAAAPLPLPAASTPAAAPAPLPVTPAPATSPLPVVPAPLPDTKQGIAQKSEPTVSTPLKEIPTTPVTATPPAPEEPATRTVQIFPPKIFTVTGFPPLELLEHPMKMDDGLSLMFTEKDMFSLVLPSIELYDKAEDRTNKTAGNSPASDDLTGLLESLQMKGEEKVKEVPQILPNIYLGSIMYYSPSNWSIWLNGKKVTNAVNTPTNSIYVESLDRTHVKLVWKPTSVTALNKVINERKIATPEVLDIEGGKVTVTMRPNQTFVTSLLAVLEGMVKQSAAPPPAAAEPANAAPTAAAAPPAPPSSAQSGMPPRKR